MNKLLLVDDDIELTSVLFATGAAVWLHQRAMHEVADSLMINPRTAHAIEAAAQAMAFG